MRSTIDFRVLSVSAAVTTIFILLANSSHGNPVGDPQSNSGQDGPPLNGPPDGPRGERRQRNRGMENPDFDSNPNENPEMGNRRMRNRGMRDRSMSENDMPDSSMMDGPGPGPGGESRTGDRTAIDPQDNYPSPNFSKTRRPEVKEPAPPAGSGSTNSNSGPSPTAPQPKSGSGSDSVPQPSPAPSPPPAGPPSSQGPPSGSGTSPGSNSDSWPSSSSSSPPPPQPRPDYSSAPPSQQPPPQQQSYNGPPPSAQQSSYNGPQQQQQQSYNGPPPSVQQQQQQPQSSSQPSMTPSQMQLLSSILSAQGSPQQQQQQQQQQQSSQYYPGQGPTGPRSSYNGQRPPPSPYYNGQAPLSSPFYNSGPGNFPVHPHPPPRIPPPDEEERTAYDAINNFLPMTPTIMESISGSMGHIFLETMPQAPFFTNMNNMVQVLTSPLTSVTSDAIGNTIRSIDDITPGIHSLKPIMDTFPGFTNLFNQMVTHPQSFLLNPDTLSVPPVGSGGYGYGGHHGPNLIPVQVPNPNGGAPNVLWVSPNGPGGGYGPGGSYSHGYDSYPYHEPTSDINVEQIMGEGAQRILGLGAFMGSCPLGTIRLIHGGCQSIINAG